jgi:hypothetical protein
MENNSILNWDLHQKLMNKRNEIIVCVGIGLNMFFPEYITIHMEEEYDPSISKPPTSAKEMFLAHPIPDVDNITPIVKLTSEQLKDLGLKN